MKTLLKLALRKIYFLLLVPALTFSACEEVIQIDLNSSIPKVVAEGLIEKDSVSWLKLSYTTNYFTTKNPTYITDARVTITDKFGNKEELNNQGDGLYKGTLLTGEAGNTYTINVTGAKYEFQAVSELNAPVIINSLKFEKPNNPRPWETANNYSLTVNFSDDATSENYYLIKFSVNDTLSSKRYTCIKNEDYTKTGSIDYSPMFLKIVENDTVKVSVYSIDKGSYTYFNQLNDIGSSAMMGTPYNAKSNFGSDVLGYFNAWSYDSKTEIIQ